MRLKHGVDFIPPEYLLILSVVMQLASAQRPLNPARSS
jgi:hypothetical protein